MVREQVNNVFLRVLPAELAEAIKADLVSKSIDMGEDQRVVWRTISAVYTFGQTLEVQPPTNGQWKGL